MLLVRIALAFASMLLLANFSHTTNNIESKQINSSSKDTKKNEAIAVTITTPVQIFQPATKQSRCGPESSDDLCAQWEAADAARDSARYAFWALIVSGVGAILLVWTLWETREISRRELRAYLRVEPTGMGIVQSEKRISLPFHIINYGATPAIDCCVQSSVVVRSPDWDWAKEPENVEQLQQAPKITIHPDSPSLIKLEMDDPLPRKVHTAILKGEAVVFGRGVISYRDMFRRKRHTSFQVEFHGADAGEDGSGGHIRISARGNDFS